ncbi:hypothetical protein LAZ67_18000987 [Cordylochernes scorpioides]|uniref:Peptidase aspartic putative domain-containing protein n=1 Tax=Cordylochernes scorpioides TaxID=51811 RepID=A0ABY6LJ41_9ARAC|nr:hypothetical protein LAZ67_18000987 [Cordylochernes scorpioides]
MRETCRTQIRFSHCRGPHHTALHPPRQVSMGNRDHGKTDRRNTEEPQSLPGEQEVALSGMHVRTAILKALLATARVRIVGPQSVGITVRALLDQGSQSFFVHQDLLHHLTVPVQKVNTQIYGINDTRGEHVKQMVSLMKKILMDKERLRPLIQQRPHRDSYALIGIVQPDSLIAPDFKYDEKTQLCAQKTRLGWIISGKLPSEGEGSPHMVYNIRVNYEENLDSILRRFWEVKEVPIRPAKSGADEFCEELYKTKVKRKKKQLVGDISFLSLLTRSLERRLAKKVPLKEEYQLFMREYIKLGHMTPLPELVAETSCEKMYRQVLVCPTDAARQKILWKETSNEPRIPYRLNTVTYGTSPAPFLDLRTLIQLAIDEGSQYPRAAGALRHFQEPTQGDEISKRGMLSLVGKQYDPMGWSAPVIMVGKIMIQRFGVAGKDWDATIDGPIKEQWKKFREQLGCLRKVRIPRWLGLMVIQDIQLHGFSDASEDAYAAAVYIRISGSDSIRAELVAVKTLLGPVRQISIPRLELGAGVLLTRLITHILTVVRLDLGTIVSWTDATIFLAWIKTIARTVVGKRVSEMQTSRQIQEWRHVPSGENPADLASRGVLGSMIGSSRLWWKGPSWLILSRNQWPKMPTITGYTPGYLIRLETGRISLSVTALKLTLKYWLRVLNMSSDRLPRVCFNRTRELSNASGTPIGFIKKLTNLLNNNGSPALVSCDDPETLRSANTGLLKTAADQSIQNDLTRMDKSRLYSHYKDIHISFMTEGYLLGDFPFPG